MAKKREVKLTIDYCCAQLEEHQARENFRHVALTDEGAHSIILDILLRRLSSCGMKAKLFAPVPITTFGILAMRV